MLTPSQPSDLARKAMRFFTADRARQYEVKARKRRLWAVEDASMRDALVSVPSGSRLLDIPVGTGRFLPLYAARGFEVVGLDVSPHMIERARARPEAAGMRIEAGNVFSIAEPDGAFDAVVCVRLMHLIEHADFALAMAELRRVALSRIILTLRIGEDDDERRGPGRLAALDACLGDWRIERSRVLRDEWHLYELCRADLR